MTEKFAIEAKRAQLKSILIELEKRGYLLHEEKLTKAAKRDLVSNFMTPSEAIRKSYREQSESSFNRQKIRSDSSVWLIVDPFYSNEELPKKFQKKFWPDYEKEKREGLEEFKF